MSSVRSPLLPSGPPPLPERLSPAQSAELAELLDYVQAVLRDASEAAVIRAGAEKVELDFPQWQALLDLQARLAELLADDRRAADGLTVHSWRVVCRLTNLHLRFLRT